MTITITLDELLDWTAEERAKWLPWFQANPKGMDVVLQPGGRFPTVASLIDHIFLVEYRHTARLARREVPTQSGIANGDVAALWAYAGLGRQGLRALIPTVTAEELNTPRDVTLADGTYRVSPRKLLIHMQLHEVRHWAQVSSALRAAGFVPPGNHDLFFSKALL